MTVSEWASMLDGREYRSEVDAREHEHAKKDGVVIVFGSSDDLMEVRGAVCDEGDCFDGGTFFIGLGGLNVDDHNCDCEFCGFDKVMGSCRKIEAVWDVEGFSWVYRTDIPHKTFTIMDDGDRYCRGIVFAVDELK